ncbi:aldehyde dehydrogenase [uncultured Robinsoniella sp.]|uniref:aldehyde dehydrogenase n=1 Tax=uncultured Robinsoniella sp. TaxID=904190 RepID=UPI00374F16CB
MNTIESIIKEQRTFFREGHTLDISFRMEQLCKLRKIIKKYEKEFYDALKEDLNKPEFEAYGTEIGLVLDEVKYLQSHVEEWAKPKRVKTSLANFPSVSRIYQEPYGVTLVMSPWNYPVLLSLDPLAGAIAAGNCVVLKPSNYSPAVSRLLKKMLGEIYPEKYVAVIEGGRAENQSLLRQKFDYIFFTGSVQVGKMVMEAASRNLTPVSLELGGKSPCIVDETADLKLAAKRIVWGKYLNAGQTCVAPDYLLVQEECKESLLAYMKGYVKQLYQKRGDGQDTYTRIVNEKHYRRIMGLIKGEKVIAGGTGNPDTLQIAPTILDDITWQSPVMQEEIFGPVMPVLTYRTLPEAIRMVSRQPKPLAAYYFTGSRKRENYFLKHTSFGGGCINDTVMHLVSSHMPFGGVGDSGMGGYHGKDSFETFSHKKSVLKKAVWLDMPFRYPPYKGIFFRILKMILK